MRSIADRVRGRQIERVMLRPRAIQRGDPDIAVDSCVVVLQAGWAFELFDEEFQDDAAPLDDAELATLVPADETIDAGVPRGTVIVDVVSAHFPSIGLRLNNGKVLVMVVNGCVVEPAVLEDDGAWESVVPGRR